MGVFVHTGSIICVCVCVLPGGRACRCGEGRGSGERKLVRLPNPTAKVRCQLSPEIRDREVLPDDTSYIFLTVLCLLCL